MKTEELIEHLNTENRISDDINAGLGMGADSKKYVVIYTPDDVEILAVPINATNWLNVHYNWYESSDDIAEPAREIVSSLISQYLNTPVSERKPKKKYRLVWQENGFEPWVLGYGISSGIWDINNEDWLNGQGYQTRFTDADLKKIADGDQDMLDRLTVLKREAPDNAD